MSLAKRSLKETFSGGGVTLPFIMLGSASAAFVHHRPEKGFFLLGLGALFFLLMWVLCAFLIKKIQNWVKTFRTDLFFLRYSNCGYTENTLLPKHTGKSQGFDFCHETTPERTTGAVDKGSAVRASRSLVRLSSCRFDFLKRQKDRRNYA